MLMTGGETLIDTTANLSGGGRRNNPGGLLHRLPSMSGHLLNLAKFPLHSPLVEVRQGNLHHIRQPRKSTFQLAHQVYLNTVRVKWALNIRMRMHLEALITGEMPSTTLMRN